MSKRLLTLSAMASVLSVAHARAQQPLAEADSLLRRVQTLDSAMLVRARVVDSVRRSLVRHGPPVDVRRGPLSIRTDSTLAPLVGEAMVPVTELIAQRGGRVLPARVTSYVPTVTRDSVRSIFGMMPVLAVGPDTARRWSRMGERHVKAPASVAELAAGLTATVEQLALQGADSTLAAWIMLGRAPLGAATPAERADAYIELVTTESAVLRRCQSRDVASCLDALGVDSLPGARLTRWYAPAEYRSLVRTLVPARDDSVAVAAWIRCRRQADASGCRIAAESLPDDRIPIPLSASVRFGFLREVLDAGGSGAFDRLLTTSGSLRRRLEAAANEPIERTTRRWLARVEAARPERARVSGGLVVASLGWTSVVLALAITQRGRGSWA